jgi:hypothetical protein
MKRNGFNCELICRSVVRERMRLLRSATLFG